MYVDSHVSSPAPTTDRQVDIDHELTEGFAAKLIRIKAKQVCRRVGFRTFDRQELEQELRLRLWKQFDKFDPEKAHWNVFATTVIERHVATILERERRIKRRKGARLLSLTDLVEDFDGELTELANTIGPEDREGLTGRYVDTAENQTDLKVDVADVVCDLPDDLRELCELLKTYNIQEAAERLGLPRTTVSARVKRLREIFSRAGIGDSFEKASSPSLETR